MSPEEFAAAVAECRRLDALNGAIIPPKEIGRIEVEDGPDVVMHDGLPRCSLSQDAATRFRASTGTRKPCSTFKLRRSTSTTTSKTGRSMR